MNQPIEGSVNSLHGRGRPVIGGSTGGEHYTRTAILLHWLLGATLLGLLVFGWVVADIPRHTPARGYYVNIHKSIGITLGILTVLRLAWRLTHRPPPMPASVARWQQRAAHAMHWLLYALMLLIPLLGYTASNFSKFGVKFFGHSLPPWGSDLPTVYKLFNGAHTVCAYILAILIGFHVLAALYHAVVRRDGILSSMWPAARRREPGW